MVALNDREREGEEVGGGGGRIDAANKQLAPTYSYTHFCHKASYRKCN